MTAIPARHREGVADWLDCRDLLREHPDPADAEGLVPVRNQPPVRSRSVADAARENGADADRRFGLSRGATACHEPPADATG